MNNETANKIATAVLTVGVAALSWKVGYKVTDFIVNKIEEIKAKNE